MAQQRRDGVAPLRHEGDHVVAVLVGQHRTIAHAHGRAREHEGADRLQVGQQRGDGAGLHRVLPLGRHTRVGGDVVGDDLVAGVFAGVQQRRGLDAAAPQNEDFHGSALCTLPALAHRRTIARVTSEPSTTSSTGKTSAHLLEQLRHERAVLDELQRCAPTLTGSELLERLAACRHRVEDINRRLQP